MPEQATPAPYRKPTLHSEQQRAERFAARAALAEAKVAAVLALLDATDAAAKQGEHLARLSTHQVRAAIDEARPAHTTSAPGTSPSS